MLFQSITLAIALTSPATADQTVMLQRLINKGAGKVVTIPTGTFLIRTLNIPKQTRLIIRGKTIIKGLPTTQTLPILNLATGVKITGAGIIDGNRLQRKKGTGIRIFDAQGVTVSGVRIREVAEQGIQAAGCKNLIFSNLKINNCGFKGIDQFQGINIITSQNVQVTGCQIENVQHGIQWWSDDTNGWCENIRITDNRVKRVEGGGIWGNKGRNVTVSNNITETCGDVGVDFEHSINCSATGNTVRDCKNYGLAIFHASQNVTFTNNKVYQGPSYGHGIGLTGDGVSKQISFVGGTINTKGMKSCGLLTVGTNIAQDVLVRGMRIKTEGKEGIPIRIIDNNQFQIINNPLIAGFSPTGISLEGSSGSVINGNLITHQGTDASKQGERGGIFIYFRSAEYPAQNNRVQSNTIQGYRTGINDECWGNVNSNNVFEQNVTPNLVHRASGGTWGGRAIKNRTATKLVAPITVK